MHDFLYFHNDWFHDKYVEHLGTDPNHFGRYHTFKIALNLFLQRGGTRIVETGCQYESSSSGSGVSTNMFGEILERYGGHLYSFDNDPDHITLSKILTFRYSDHTFYSCGDSVACLKEFDAPIDLLYLDSYDYPYGELLELHGGKTDINKAIAKLRTYTEDELVDKYSDIIGGCQCHCLNEVRAAEPNLHANSVVLIDDSNLPGGGKARLARKWLKTNGWYVILDYYQTVWIKGS